MSIADQKAAKRYKQLKHLQSEACDALEKSNFANAQFKNRCRMRRKTIIALMPNIYWMLNEAAL